MSEKREKKKIEMVFRKKCSYASVKAVLKLVQYMNVNVLCIYIYIIERNVSCAP